MVSSMNIIRDPIGEIKKQKSRLYPRGNKYIDYVDYWNIYSPVVSCNTVRLMLVMELINYLNMQSIEFVLELLRSPIKTDIYMKPPSQICT